MGVIRHKTWHDLWENKGRTLQAVLIIAIGAFAIGAIMGSAHYIREDLNRTWQSTQPAMIGFWVDPPVDKAMLETLAHLPGVETVEGKQDQNLKWRRSPNDPWQGGDLSAREDYEDQALNRITLDAGEWPQRKMVAVERGHGFELGDELYLEIEEKEHKVTIGGIIYNADAAPVTFGGNPIFYTTRERFIQLTGENGFTMVLAALPAYDPLEAITVADRLQHHLEKQDIQIYPALADGRTADPTEHFIQEDVDAVFFILTCLAIISLVLGLFLVYNTITAIMTQQVNQIGMMKAIGATFPRILGVYFGQVLAYAVLALLLAVPLGTLGAHGLRLILMSLFNMEPGPLVLLPHIILIQAGIALISPLLIAILPIFIGARITVREALSTYGLGGAAGFIDRFLVKTEALPRTVIHVISNTFRHKGRVVVTQLTLVGSGLVFMMVMHTQASLLYTYGEIIFVTFKANVFLNLQEEGRIQAVEEIALAHPEVTAVEMWGFADGTLRPAGRPENNDDPQADIRGLPAPTLTYVPQMRAGRWLRPEDTYAMVLNQELAEKIGVGVGDWVTLDIPLEGETRWEVVGLLFEVFNENAAHVPRDILLKEIDQVGLARNIRAQTRRQDAAGEAAIAAELRQYYETNGYKLQVGDQNTAHEITEEIMEGGVSVIINLLAAMAVVIAAVGAVALSGVLSINILERRREIGVMRAIGASSFHIFRLFIGEGLLLGWLSWLIALPLSLPAGMLLTYALSTIMGGELSYSYSLQGMFYWLGIVTVLSILASLLPARGATRISVRESLAYQ